MKLLDEYSKPEQAALRTEVCPEATDDQINYFLRVCHARSIDPFSGLLYMQRRQNKGRWKCSVQPTVDGSRAAAARTGDYAGSDEPEFDTEDADHPAWCRVTVYRNVRGARYAFTAKCRWREFVPSPPNDFQWKGKPFHMLAKVTEVQALRKAFPEHVVATGEDDFEGETESLPQAEDHERTKVAINWTNAVNAFQALGKKEAEMLAYLSEVYGPVGRDNVTADHIDSLKVWYDELRREIKA